MGIAAQTVLLLLTRDSGRPAIDRRTVQVAVAGAVLAELAARGRVGLDDGRLVIGDGSAPGHPVLDAGLAAARSRVGRRPKTFVVKEAGQLADAGYRSLEAEGLVRRLGPLLGLGAARWPLTDRARRDAEVERLAAVVRGQAPVDDNAAIVLPVLRAVGATRRLLAPATGLRGRALDRAVDDVAERHWAATATAAAVAEAQAAVLAAVTASIASTTG